MEKYCKGCDDRGTEVCKMPSRAEVVLRNAWRIAAPAIESAAGTSGVVFGGLALPIEGTASIDAQQRVDAMHERVSECVAMHEDLAASLANL